MLVAIKWLGRSELRLVGESLADRLSSGLDMFIDVCFGVDMILSFQTAYVDAHSLTVVHSRKLIMKKYVSGWLTIDLVSTLPIDKARGRALISLRPALIPQILGQLLV
mmetsp:Transcript_2641/g.7866  ORF Transcript_2641/g.7866 Transcript_2641/m.7866 type:complete len:108 (-) Transcript_2641:1162-1485(-)